MSESSSSVKRLQRSPRFRVIYAETDGDIFKEVVLSSETLRGFVAKLCPTTRTGIIKAEEDVERTSRIVFINYNG